MQNVKEPPTCLHVVLQHQGGVHSPPSCAERVTWHQAASIPPNEEMTRVRGGPRGTNRIMHNAREAITSLHIVLQGQRGVHSPPSSTEGVTWHRPASRLSNEDITREGEDNEGPTVQCTTRERRSPASPLYYNVREESTRLLTGQKRSPGTSQRPCHPMRT